MTAAPPFPLFYWGWDGIFFDFHRLIFEKPVVVRFFVFEIIIVFYWLCTGGYGYRSGYQI